MAMTSELFALHLMCKHYENGVKGMAEVLGISADLLGKKLRDEQGHKLGPAEVGMINDACIRKQTEHCLAYINCIAGSAGVTLSRLPVIEMKECVGESAADVIEEAAEMASEIFRSNADNDLSDNDMKRIESRAHDVIAAIQSGLEACRRKHAKGAAAKKAKAGKP
ncbi:phage regulatory CII family protein [Comamonas sp.]|uniref:phage regulatory CII family protein n=1 Tax=Comamonas sp. TaxID=34028 RepID=UPI00289CB5E0|nr:phage regulatory CII family protein [Comamonas sp.]